MCIVLAQRIDIESSYEDELFKTYHFPARYRNVIKSGDVFVYYQGNRYEKAHRYYFGTGVIGKIRTDDGENYYAEIVYGERFNNVVPIYKANGGYLESIGYDTVRKSENPPWQSSIRPISEDAFNKIISLSGGVSETCHNRSNANVKSETELKAELKKAVKSFYLESNDDAILSVAKIAQEIARNKNMTGAGILALEDSKAVDDKQYNLVEFCKTMYMSYSYKPVLLKALMQLANETGAAQLNEVVSFFMRFYTDRRNNGLVVEKANSIFFNRVVSQEDAKRNIINNPVKALSTAGVINFERKMDTIKITTVIWQRLDDKTRHAIEEVCEEKLDSYYARISK